MAGAMTEHTGTVDSQARGKAAEALQAVLSLERLMKLQFDNVDARFRDIAAAATASEDRTNRNQTNGEGRLKSEMGAIEGRLLAAIGEIKDRMDAQTALYSNRFWDTTLKIILGLVAAIWAGAFAYVGSLGHR